MNSVCLAGYEEPARQTLPKLKVIQRLTVSLTDNPQEPTPRRATGHVVVTYMGRIRVVHLHQRLHTPAR